MAAIAGPVIRALKPNPAIYDSAMLKWKSTVPKEFLPTLVNGRWQKPKFSAMRIAKLRKEVLLSGHEWKWDKPQKERPLVVMKGRKAEVSSAERWKTIEENMKGMDKKLDDYRKAMRARRPRRNNFLWILENA